MTKSKLMIVILSLVLGMIAYPAFAQNTDSRVAPDNTQMNMRDRDPSEPTADQGANQQSDREIMANIRKSIVADKSLSTYAHNIKIISVNGKVTLKGPVRSEAESQTIVDKAGQVVSADNITNQLSVKAPQ